MTIEPSLDIDSDTCLLRIRGTLDIAEIIPVLEAQFEKHASGTMLWDVRTSDASNVGLEGLKALSAAASRWDHLRNNPRSVGVIDPGIMYMLARLFSAMNIARGRKLNFRTFLTMNEALAWLEIKQPLPGWADPA